MIRIRNRPPAEGSRNCPLCRESLLGSDPLGAEDCVGCGTFYHRGCLIEMGGCSTLGCRAGPPVHGGRRARRQGDQETLLLLVALAFVALPVVGALVALLG